MKRGYILGYLGVVILSLIAGSIALWASFIILSGSLRLTFALLGVIILTAGAAEFLLFLYARRRSRNVPRDASPEEIVETWRRH